MTTLDCAHRGLPPESGRGSRYKPISTGELNYALWPPRALITGPCHNLDHAMDLLGEIREVKLAADIVYENAVSIS